MNIVNTFKALKTGHIHIALCVCVCVCVGITLLLKMNPAQVQCIRQGAWGWCTRMTQRDGMGREVGRGFRMGNTCTPMEDSSKCMAKTTTIL